MYEVQLDAFNGPLDLLLHLINEFEIDIYDIPMKELTQQYMQYIHAMKQLEINVASEYLLTASELLMIKSKMLLPDYHQDELVEEEDPREELVEKLIEYQNYKAYAVMLLEEQKERNLQYAKPPSDLSRYEKKEQITDNVTMDITDLIIAYQKLKSRVALKKTHPVKIQKETFTVQQSTKKIFKALENKNTITFFELFQFNEPIEYVVTHFLALLDMAKSGLVQLSQSEAFQNIEISKGVNYEYPIN